MNRRPRVGALALAACLAWSGHADGRRAISPSQVESRASQGTTAIFVCGDDEKLPRIALHWINVVLAGDGRLYTPCPAGMHLPDHREVREAIVIGEGRYWGDGEIRWRAAQAQARNSAMPQIFPVPGGGNPPRAGSLEYVLAQLDGLGGLIDGLIVTSACDAEVQLFGGTANPRRWQPGRLFSMLREVRGYAIFGGDAATKPPSPGVFALFRTRVSAEGAFAIGSLLSRSGLDVNVIRAATKELRACFIAFNFDRNLGEGEVAGLILEDLGLAHYGNNAEITEAEQFLTEQSQGGVLKILGAVKGLEALIRQHPLHVIGGATRARLRQLVTHGVRTGQPLSLDGDARIRRFALLALQAARDRDDSTLRQAATDGDWQVRRLVAASLTLSDPPMAALGELLAADPAFQVRYELLSPLARLVAQTRECAPVAARLLDPSPVVVMRAMDVLSATCTDIDEAMPRLIALADDLAKSVERDWHIPSRALTTLARIRPAEARPRLAAAVRHPVWQVRATAAAMSLTLADEASATTLVRDPEPNVQTAALDALYRLRSAAVVPRAIDVLRNSHDYHLLRTAAVVLRGLPAEARKDASDALLIALHRLTGEETDTSRDPRVAILDRLTETLDTSRATELLPFVGDYDDDVSKAAITALTSLAQAPPPPGSRRRRYPFQPPPAALGSLPSEALIQLEDGMVTLRLLHDVAPVTVARFAALATQGYYNGLTFHRVVPNFVAQGGSPGANDYMGTARYMRDEVGPQGVHVRGAVGMSNRGKDTGDGQFFIDLVDLPHLDRAYTVFAYVTQGMEFVDRLLDGAKIVKVSVR